MLVLTWTTSIRLFTHALLASKVCSYHTANFDAAIHKFLRILVESVYACKFSAFAGNGDLKVTCLALWKLIHQTRKNSSQTGLEGKRTRTSLALGYIGSVLLGQAHKA